MLVLGALLLIMPVRSALGIVVRLNANMVICIFAFTHAATLFSSLVLDEGACYSAWCVIIDDAGTVGVVVRLN